jgi:hypothetical protein
MSDFTETAQRLAPPLRLPGVRFAAARWRREPPVEARESVRTWLRFAAAGIVIAWLVSLGTFGAAAPKARAAAPPDDRPTVYFPTLHRDARLTAAEQPETF